MKPFLRRHRPEAKQSASTSTSTSTITSPTTSPVPKCSKYSLWDRSPEEIKANIFSYCDPLTLHLNGRLVLSKDHRKHQRILTEVWTTAFEIGWEGDLKLLPMDGFPNAWNGLCKVTSRSLYERLRILRPDLDHQVPGLARDMINIFVNNDPAFGHITNISHSCYSDCPIPDTTSRPIPITYVDEDDMLSPKVNGCGFIPLEGQYQMVKCLESLLINIPMRMGWKDIVKSYARKNPKIMVIIGALMNHLELLKVIVEDMKLIDSLDLVDLEFYAETFKPYLAATRNGNLEMIKFLAKHGRKMERKLDGNCPEATEVMTSAIQLGHLAILQHLESSASYFNEYIVEVETFTTNMDVCEWHWDICFKLGKESKVTQIPMYEESVQRIADNIDIKQPFSMGKALRALANTCRLDLFEKLFHVLMASSNPSRWLWDIADIVKFNSAGTNMELVMSRYIDFDCNLFRRFYLPGNQDHFFAYPSPEAIRLKHQYQHDSKCPCFLNGIDLYWLFKFSHPDHDKVSCVMALYEVCKCLYQNGKWIDQLSLDRYISYDTHANDLNMVELLINHNEKGQSTALFVAAKHNMLEVVKYLCENTGLNNTWVWSEEEINEASRLAAENANVMIVKYLHDTKQTPYPDSLAVSLVTKERPDLIQYINENIPEVVFTPEVMDAAAKRGNLRLVKYLYQNRTEGCTKNAMDECLSSGQFAAATLLWKLYPQLFDFDELFEKYGNIKYINPFLPKSKEVVMGDFLKGLVKVKRADQMKAGLQKK
ncbi:hypothetical protein HDU76_012566 [Blyttiomyces sp. JEL0837]|nr:hypothetical protein HDU76_012566 [Blyttiomyces sp. JEL0837]